MSAIPRSTRIRITLDARADLRDANLPLEPRNCAAFARAYRRALAHVTKRLGLTDVAMIEAPGGSATAYDYETRTPVMGDDGDPDGDSLERRLWQAAHDRTCRRGGRWTVVSRRIGRDLADAIEDAS